MKIKELFEYVDEVMENVFSERVKLRWLNQIEAELQVDVLLLAPEGIARYDEKDLETELIAPPPFDELYTEYLQYRICLAQQEPERANNAAETFNRAYNEYVRHIAQMVCPGNGMAEQMQYYISAYQIAVKHGFEGSEEDWLRSLEGTKIHMVYDEATKTLIIETADRSDDGATNGDGASGNSIASIEQTVTSTADGGINEITATMTDGSTSVFQIRNGSKGATGKNGTSFEALRYDAETGKWMQMVNSSGDLIETEVNGPDVYSKDQIDNMFSSYITEVAALLGGDA